MMLFSSFCISWVIPLFCAINLYLVETGDAALLPSSLPRVKSPVVSLDVSHGDHHQHLWKRSQRKWKPMSTKEQLDATDYLIKYGYLKVPVHEDTPFSSSSLLKMSLDVSLASSLRMMSSDSFRDAVSSLQSFASLPATGIFDEETKTLLKRPRCGVKDIQKDEDDMKRVVLPEGHDQGASGDNHYNPSFNQQANQVILSSNSIVSRVKRYSLQGGKWSRTNLTWSIRHWPKNIDPNMLRQELSRALEVWSNVSQLTFEETRSEDADIVVSFRSGPHGDNYDFDGPGNILAHAFFPMKGSSLGGDAHFDADEKWVKNSAVQPKNSSLSSSSSGRNSGSSLNNNDVNFSPDGVSLFAVAAHEFGHSLGLSHSSVPGSLMFPYYQSMKDDYELPYDDTVGIQQLYGPKDGNRWAPLPHPAPDSPKGGLPSDPTSTPKPKTSTPSSQWPSIPPSSGPPPGGGFYPETCNTSFDAISSIRREVFIFKGKYFWRLDDNKQLETLAPVEISKFWYNLPRDLKRIDAVYERPKDKLIVFFIGSRYWVFSGNYPLVGYPKPLTNLGLPAGLDSIDAAMVWGHNGKTYLFSGRKYWRLEDSQDRVEPDYPRDMNIWRGIPYGVDAAFQWHRTGSNYFFKGSLFWKFDNRKMKVTRDSPKKSVDWWFSTLCRSKYGGIPEYFEDDDDDIKMNGAFKGRESSHFTFSVLSFLAFTLFYSGLKVD